MSMQLFLHNLKQDFNYLPTFHPGQTKAQKPILFGIEINRIWSDLVLFTNALNLH